ncbi:hypothetical protein V5O48_004055 [Marasmius crinis-equi]|uniref:Small ribosomal subunit protein mS38 n=1 Tax=Marasmius crinis-equi TaxID=585013 RepID=A0ABR3FRZ6_9AGAR
MSSLTRLVRLHTPARSRAYSSFFSSKPGGGRYFNPTKPPNKAVVPAKNTTTTKQAQAQDAVDSENQQVEAAESTPPASPVPSPSTINFTSLPTTTRSSHPVIGDKDFKLHEFFSLHRPLLLLSQPSSILTNAPGNTFSFQPPPPPPPQQSQAGPMEDLSYEADAETARSLTRAMTMNRLGSTVAWEATLQRLGLGLDVGAQQEDKERLQQEYRDVVMDSVKRKRRKKMKKHKLKKRRRATREQRRGMK